MPTKAELEQENADLRGHVWTLEAVVRSLLEADKRMSAALGHLNDAGRCRQEAWETISPLAKFRAPDG